MTHSVRPQPFRGSLEEILEDHIQTLATTLQRYTVKNYRCAIHQFFFYIHDAFPQVRRLSQLCRDPHLLGWFRWLCDHDPPLCNTTREKYLLCLRRVFHDLEVNGHSLQSNLILPEDFPPLPQPLPRALSSDDDQLLQQELRRADSLPSNALLLIRATGIRIGECIHLALDCLRPLGQDQWALHVPLGKMHTERMVPVDENVRQIVNRILVLRAQAPPHRLAKSAGWLLPRSGGFYALQGLRPALTRAAERAGCSHRVTPHQLRHTFASEMLRLGVSLPALMQLLGHKDIRMTLRYLQITQQDLQREFRLARQNAAHRHLVPQLTLPDSSFSGSDLPGIRQALAATRHLLEMYRRQLGDENTRHKLQRLDKRLLTIAFELDRLVKAQK
jgi:site-specific recombinase XerD